MIDRFQELLSELGKVFNLPLHTDRYHACSLQIPPLVIQLQLDSAQENIILFSKLIELPPGKFRENILRESLKANGLATPKAGVLGYIANTNHLALFQKYPLDILNGERLAGFFGAFFEYGVAWNQAIGQGQMSPPGLIETPLRPFGSRS